MKLKITISILLIISVTAFAQNKTYRADYLHSDSVNTVVSYEKQERIDNNLTDEPMYSITITPYDGINEGHVLKLGIDPNATNEIDADLGEAELPGTPPNGTPYVRFVLPDLTTSSYSDYRKGTSQIVEIISYNVLWQISEGAEGIMFNIDIPEVVGTVKIKIKDSDGGGIFNEEIYEGTSQIVITNTAITDLLFEVDYHAPVPVEFISFSSFGGNGYIRLDWATATETNNQGFEVERSKDGKQFIKIGFIDGNGTTTEISNYSFTDNTPYSGKTYYRLKQIDFDGRAEYSKIVEADFIPAEFALNQNYPNPFNPSTKIKFALPVESHVTITLYNMIGQKVKDIVSSNYAGGIHEVEFNAENLSSGTYIYSVIASGNDGRNFSDSKKMLLMK